jgi:hypothetical protein
VVVIAHQTFKEALAQPSTRSHLIHDHWAKLAVVTNENKMLAALQKGRNI